MIVLILLLGWALGIFANYVADVMPHRRSFARPFCLVCEQEQPWLNYLIWPRQCSNCKKRRAARTWLVEGIAILVTYWLWLNPSISIGFPVGILILLYFGIVMIIDIEHHLILHPISLVGGIIGFAVGSWRHGIWDTVLGAIAGLCLMSILYLLGFLFVRFIIHRSQQDYSEEALGFGDVVLGGVLGLFLGWPAILLGLFLAIAFAGVASFGYLVLKMLTRSYRAFTFIPYGPFLIIGAAALIFFRDAILILFNR